MSGTTFNTSNDLLLAKTLTDLIEHELKLTPASLARKLGIPANKITRILNGDVTDPKASTLLQIANYFDISIEQLLGLKPLTRESSTQQTSETQPLAIYNFSQPNQNTRQWYRWAPNEISGEYFALSLDTDIYEPTFTQNSLLIINPDITPEDRSYVVVKEINDPGYCSIKKYVLEGKKIYLYPIHPGLSVEIFDKSVYIIAGVILEVHQKLRSKK